MALQQIANQICPGSHLVKFWPLKGGISAIMTAFELESPEGKIKRYVLRSFDQDNGDHDPYPEYQTLLAVHDQGLAVPRPVHYDNSRRYYHTAFMVVEYTAAEMTFTPADTEAYLCQMAEYLTHIHSLDVAKLNLQFLPRHNRCREFNAVAGQKSLDPDSTAIRKKLARTPIAASNTVTLLHGDFWPGNTLWQDGRLAAVVDWEDAEIGDPLIDLARSRSEIAWIFGHSALQIFTQYYQSLVDIDYTDLPYWDLCAALRQLRLIVADIQEIADFFAAHGRPDITEQSIKQNLTNFINESLRH